jgi:hypothetical protein
MKRSTTGLSLRYFSVALATGQGRSGRSPDSTFNCADRHRLAGKEVVGRWRLRAWAQPSEYFEARTRYLALADKAARTVVMLTERLDHHRGRGQQKIVVQHTTTTVNADQAVVTTGNPA